MWIIILSLSLIAMIAGFIYLTSKIYRFDFIRKLSKEKKLVRIVISILPIVLVTMILVFIMGFMNTLVSLIHLVIFWLLCDLVICCIQKVRKKKFKRSYSGVFAIVITVGYLSVGWFNAHHVWITEYSIQTDKAVGDLRIVQFADSHIGTTFDGLGVVKYVRQIQDLNPDIVLITGDFVDDDTTKTDMILTCKALGTLKTTYGVYYSFGNHDKGYYGSEYRGFSGNDLINELTNNGVKVLQDENVLLDNRFYVIGRQDVSEDIIGNSRATMTDLVKNLDPNKYSIVMDHQPNDYKNEANAKVDLVLSGHTHGGQLFPLGIVGELIGANDMTYGIKKIDTTNFIVTSGISNWALGFKTFCKSEIVVVDVKGK